MKKKLEANDHLMMCLDVYLGTRGGEMEEEMKQGYQPAAARKFPLMSWDHFAMDRHNLMSEAAKRLDIERLSDYGRKHNLSEDFDFIWDKNYSALVLTDASQVILWVNKGFFKMTGYTSKAAVGRKPTFLQGRDTCEISRQRLREKLSTEMPFKETILNYKKDRTPYLCEIEIFPLKDPEDSTQAYLAVEKELL
jgi:PAS domain S-box-containing protein